MIMIWIAVIVVTGVIGLNVLAYNHACAMMFFTDSDKRINKPETLSSWSKAKVLLTGINIPRPVSQNELEDLALDCRSVLIESNDGITLASWYCNRGEKSPLTILFHGYSSEKTALLSEAKALLDIGSSVLLVDFRGSGDSSESYTTIGVHEAEDVQTVIRYAEQHLTHSKTILFGQSMGAAAILKTAHEYGLSADAVILEAIFDTLLNTVQNRFQAMHIPSFPCAELLVFWGGKRGKYNGFQHNPIDYAPSLKCPALFMHGADDPRAKIIEGYRVYEAAPEPKKFVTFPQTGHESYICAHAEQWRAAIEDFINNTNISRTETN